MLYNQVEEYSVLTIELTVETSSSRNGKP